MDVGNTKGAPRRGLEFWRGAVARLQAGESAGAVAKELGVDVRGLNRWRQRLEMRQQHPQRQREAALVKEVEKLKRALADKVLEVDFLQGALHKIEERRRKSGNTGAQASTTRSGK
jgi:transposase